MIGSHLDTVEAGGRFDGIAGVLAGLEVARCLDAGGHRLRHPLEVVNFTCEEPSDFGLSTIGSRAMSGKLDAATAARLRDRAGRTLAEAIDSVGGRGGRARRGPARPGRRRPVPRAPHRAIRIARPREGPGRRRDRDRRAQPLPGGDPRPSGSRGGHADGGPAGRGRGGRGARAARRARGAGGRAGMVGHRRLPRDAAQHDQHRAGRSGSPRGLPRDRAGRDRRDAGAFRGGGGGARRAARRGDRMDVPHAGRAAHGRAGDGHGRRGGGRAPSGRPGAGSRAGPATTPTTWRGSARSGSSSSRAATDGATARRSGRRSSTSRPAPASCWSSSSASTATSPEAAGAPHP